MLCSALLRFRIFHTKGLYSNLFHALGVPGAYPGNPWPSQRSCLPHPLPSIIFPKAAYSPSRWGAASCMIKKLAASGIGNHGARHGENAGSVCQIVFEAVVGEFSADAVAGASGSHAVGISALQHKALDDAMENHTVIEALLNQGDEIVYGIGGDFGIKFRLSSRRRFPFQW